MKEGHVETELTFRVNDISTVINLLNEYDISWAGGQFDRYLSPPHENFRDDRVNYLRVRSDTTGAEDSIAYHVVKDDERTEEFETAIDEPERLVGILEEVGFEVYAEVNKSRTEFDAGDFTVTFDLVNEIGGFIEIEATRDVDDDELRRLTDELELSEADEVVGKGYPDLVVESEDGTR